jgi:hypothetical protein
MIGVAEFISDENLLGRFFAGRHQPAPRARPIDSWATWRIALKGAFAEPMTPSEVTRFREIAGRDPPETCVRELWLALGRRAGKDSIASAIAVHASATGDFARHLRPGEKATILCLATNREQAAIVFDYIKASFEQVPLLAPLVRRVDADTVELTNGVEINVATNSFRSIRGRTVALAILDELAFWRDESGAYQSPDTEVYRAILPSLTTLRNAGSMIIGISSVYRRSGLLYDKIRQHYGQPGDILAIIAPTRTFNPTIDQAEIDRDIADDPERFNAEWNSIWRSDISDMFDRELVEAAVDPGVIVRPPRPFHSYRAFTDASGGRGDAFTAAIAHDESDRVYVDATFERAAPFDPAIVVGEVAELLRSYGLSEVIGDKYAANWCSLAFEKAGISYTDSERDRSQIYLDALPVFTSGRARLTDNRRLLTQLCALERRTTRTGRDLVNHPAGANDDLANAVCGAITAVTARPVPYLWDWRADIRRYLAEHPDAAD